MTQSTTRPRPSARTLELLKAQEVLDTQAEGYRRLLVSIERQREVIRVADLEATLISEVQGKIERPGPSTSDARRPVEPSPNRWASTLNRASRHSRRCFRSPPPTDSSRRPNRELLDRSRASSRSSSPPATPSPDTWRASSRA